MSNLFRFLFSFSLHSSTNRIHRTSSWRASDDAGRDAAADANDVLGESSDAIDDAAALPVIQSADEWDRTAARSTRNYKPNEFFLLSRKRSARSELLGELRS